MLDGMNDAAYVLPVPRRMRLESRSHLHDVTQWEPTDARENTRRHPWTRCSGRG